MPLGSPASRFREIRVYRWHPRLATPWTTLFSLQPSMHPNGSTPSICRRIRIWDQVLSVCWFETSRGSPINLNHVRTRTLGVIASSGLHLFLVPSAETGPEQSVRDDLNDATNVQSSFFADSISVPSRGQMWIWTGLLPPSIAWIHQGLGTESLVSRRWEILRFG